MTRLLQEAFNQLQNLPPQQQDDVALRLFSQLGAFVTSAKTREQDNADIQALSDGLDDGSTELLTDDELAAFKKSCGL